MKFLICFACFDYFTLSFLDQIRVKLELLLVEFLLSTSPFLEGTSTHKDLLVAATAAEGPRLLLQGGVLDDPLLGGHLGMGLLLERDVGSAVAVRAASRAHGLWRNKRAG